MQFTNLTALSPLDGRYANKLSGLRDIMSEYGLIYYRLFVEIRWLEFLATRPEFSDIPTLSTEAQNYLQYILVEFDLNAAEQIKTIEQTTKHDVKAIEYYLRNQFTHHRELAPLIPFIHFGCTSEDINNIAYSLMLQKTRSEILMPSMQALIVKLQQMAEQYMQIAMLCRTHGQSATPSTLGKEIANFMLRLNQQAQQFQHTSIVAKFNGATGNFNAHAVGYPQLNWPQLSTEFIQSLGLVPNLHTTQIEPHDNLAEILQTLSRFNTILLDLNRDIWGYISLGYLQQEKVAAEIGSSTMPHKVNPIDFENSEGNLGIANALAHHFAAKLPISRWQRDLSDSTVLRNLGCILGYSLLAYQATEQGLRKLTANKQQIDHDLQQHWEVLAEAIQTVMRRYGILDAYERIKAIARGKTIDQQTLYTFIQDQPLPPIVKEQLQQLTPADYIGFATELTQSALTQIHNS